ncbi:hypothetical protein ACFQ5D_07080 [Paenibacillus farraposensis]|uniref:DUF2269 family protein n=1 Tax=Paenibacillus farraposensis TaxID=2807095 RepID=A0ABW4DBQ7_9BACL|nr:hypothetical protein [Paenibacillus farraposensis]MCC3381579.1 hypothetical protein [Paenibacillus farraposensis]
MFFIHVIGSLAMGFYLLLPFVLGKIDRMTPAVQEGTLSAVQLLNRLAQFALILMLVSGVYMIVAWNSYSVAWIVVVVLLFLAISGIAGAMGKPLRLSLEAIRNQQPMTQYAGKMRMFSTLLAVFLILITFLMVYSHII